MDGLSAMVFGSFELPAGERAAWEQASLDPARWRDWPEGPLFEIQGGAASPAALFEMIEEADETVSFLERSHEGDRVEIMGVLEGEEAILGAHLGILCAARAAAELGARGQVAIVIPAFEGATLVRLDGKKRESSSVEPMPAGEVLKDEALARLAVSIHGWAADKQSEPSLRRAPWREGEARFWLDGAPGEAERSALEGARALSDAELTKLLADDVMVAPSLEPLGASVTFDELKRAIEGSTPLARAIAISLFARVRGDAALEPAIALASAPSKYLSRMALRSLGWMSDPRALSALERALFEHPSEFIHAVEGIAHSPAPGVDAAIVRWLDGDDFDLEKDGRERRYGRALKILEAVGARANRDHIARLFVLFEDPKARPLVPQIVRALARLGGDAVEARGQELQIAMMGMGKALNQDHARRAVILRIEDEENGGILRYDDLDLERLVQLLDEGFIHPQARQNEAPSTMEFFGLMQEHPELRASGYAVVPSRPDYRVMIDSLRAELAGVSSERADELRALFEALGQNASNMEIEGDVVSVWWT